MYMHCTTHHLMYLAAAERAVVVRVKHPEEGAQVGLLLLRKRDLVLLPLQWA
jgi:hypothetical protein